MPNTKNRNGVQNNVLHQAIKTFKINKKNKK